MKPFNRILSGSLLLVVALGFVGPASAIELHAVPVPIESGRLLGMSRDDDGGIWCGSFRKAVHRYDPRSGRIETIALPNSSTASACLCVGRKVYVLGQAYPKLVIYDRTARTFRELPYPTEKPEVWYGTEAFDGRHLYLFDRGSHSIIKWDTTTDVGTAVRYPFDPPGLNAGRYVAADGALWCLVSEPEKFKYRQLGMARYDLATDAFTDYVPFPAADAELPPPGDPAKSLFVPQTLRGKLAVLDMPTRRWRRPIEVPGYGKRFAFMGQGTQHGDRFYYSISTYDGSEIGCDGLPYHFCNGLLEFDPASGRFDFLELKADDAYYQVSNAVSSGGEFYATGTDIREPDGTLNSRRIGKIVVWTTARPEPHKKAGNATK